MAKQAKKQWYVRIALLARGNATEYWLGPCSSWSHARNISKRWESEHGVCTAMPVFEEPLHEQAAA